MKLWAAHNVHGKNNLNTYYFQSNDDWSGKISSSDALFPYLTRNLNIASAKGDFYIEQANISNAPTLSLAAGKRSAAAFKANVTRKLASAKTM